MTVIELKSWLDKFNDNIDVYIVVKNKIKSIDCLGKGVDQDTNKPSCVIYIKE